MKKNLILTTAVGYNFSQVKLFIKSLRKYYFEDVCFLIGRDDHELEKDLKEYNCNIIKTNVYRKAIQFKRYEIFLKYVASREFNNVFLCDSRDIYFQKDPFKYNYNGPINFFLEDQQIKI